MSGLLRIVLIMFVLSLSAAALGGDLAKGRAALNNGDYDTALSEWQPLAEAGDSEAQFCMGYLYANGFGVPMDDAEALKWYGLAAAGGYAEAQYNLGVMHANGWGVPMDEGEAINWYQLAADQGFVAAQMSLANIYSSAWGEKQSPVDAYMWYEIAAQLGDTDAQLRRKEVAEKLSEDELLQAQQQALHWLDSFQGETINANRID